MLEEVCVTKPEVIILSGQTKEEVENTFKIVNEESKKEKEKFNDFFEPCNPNPKLTFESSKLEDYDLKYFNGQQPDISDRANAELNFSEDELYCLKKLSNLKTSKEKDSFEYHNTFEEVKPVRMKKCKSKKNIHVSSEDAENMCDSWRKLCGLKYEEETSIRSKDLTSGLTTQLHEKFPNLEFGWSDNNYSKCLTINGALTVFNSVGLMRAYEGLAAITDENDTMDLLVTTVSKKINSLFI